MLSYNSLGGTGPKAVDQMLKDMQSQLEHHRKVLESDVNRVSSSRKATGEIVTRANTVKTAEDLKKLVKQYRPVFRK